MGQITGYEIINGVKSKKHDYEAKVFTQSDIEYHRSKLKKKHANKTGDYNIVFHLMLEQLEVGTMIA